VALTYYETQTARLLQNPAAPNTLYSTTDIDSWINTARGQIAADGECIRFTGALPTSNGQIEYNFEDIDTGVSATNGIEGPIIVRAIRFALDNGSKWVTPRTWDWFQEVNLNNPGVVNGAPQFWAQFQQGTGQTGGSSTAGAVSTGGGTFFLDPPPDGIYDLLLDCVCFPIALVDDTTPEAIPYLWTDCVPYLAAWYALLASQTNARRADAEAYYKYYQTFLQKMRKVSSPTVNRYTYIEQAAMMPAQRTGQP
jgi:hypothetical protein